MANSRQDTEKMMGGAGVGVGVVAAPPAISCNSSHEGSLSPGSGSATLMRHSPDINQHQQQQQQHPYGNNSPARTATPLCNRNRY
ncbi:membrane metallo-endopeptidase-like 1 [Drosophila madeirensis]|uniref:Membrane metallo-endopeptidase-like 1 n=1 Tax=Drosophila madeirensis TaxID=30013 RepID=A0AAU9FU05_DROMD